MISSYYTNHKQVREILKKRNGDFPRKISDQKFNTYVKVAEIAGLNANRENHVK
jgi:hypothetical protein